MKIPCDFNKDDYLELHVEDNFLFLTLFYLGVPYDLRLNNETTNELIQKLNLLKDELK